MKTVIIVLNWNQGRLTCDCVAEVLHRTPLRDVQCLVVDNGSTEGSQELLHKYFGRNKSVDLLFLDKNYGYVDGMNLGYHHAVSKYNPKYVVLMNNDIFVGKGWFTELISCLDKYKQVGIVSPVLCNKDGTLQTAGTKFKSSFLGLLKEVLSPSELRQWFGKPFPSKQYIFQDTIMGACSVYRTSLFGDYIFDPNYAPFNVEEIDVQYSLKKQKFRLVVCSCSKAFHVGHVSLDSLSNSYKNYVSCKNALYFVKKHIGRFYVPLAFCVAMPSLFISHEFKLKTNDFFYRMFSVINLAIYSLLLTMDVSS